MFALNYQFLLLVIGTLIAAKSYVAMPGRLPYVVIIKDVKMSQRYGGVILTKSNVLTTCTAVAYVKDGETRETLKDASSLTIVASNGDWKNDPRRQTRRGYVIYKHAECRLADVVVPDVNLAVVMLNEDLTPTPYIRSVQPFLRASRSVTNSVKRLQRQIPINDATMIGWGDAVSPLRMGFTRVVGARVCSKHLCATEKIKCGASLDNFLCVESVQVNQETNECLGEPGTPLVFNRTVVGISSVSFGCGPGSRVVFTNILPMKNLTAQFYSSARRMTFTISPWLLFAVHKVTSIFPSQEL